MKRIRKIQVTEHAVAALAQEFEQPSAVIRAALEGDIDIVQARTIRALALTKYGGSWLV